MQSHNCDYDAGDETAFQNCHLSSSTDYIRDIGMLKRRQNIGRSPNGAADDNVDNLVTSDADARGTSLYSCHHLKDVDWIPDCCDIDEVGSTFSDASLGSGDGDYDELDWVPMCDLAAASSVDLYQEEDSCTSDSDVSGNYNNNNNDKNKNKNNKSSDDDDDGHRTSRHSSCSRSRSCSGRRKRSRSEDDRSRSRSRSKPKSRSSKRSTSSSSGISKSESKKRKRSSSDGQLSLVYTI